MLRCSYCYKEINYDLDKRLPICRACDTQMTPPMPTRGTPCPVCLVRFIDDPNAKLRCIATHAVGVCCHLGQLICCDDGSTQRAVPWPDCVTETLRWITAVMDCAICSRHWVAVYPECAPSLECPGCGYMNERRDELVERGW